MTNPPLSDLSPSAPKPAVEAAFGVKSNLTLTIASLLSILLLTLHVTDDIVRGISPAEPANTALLVLGLFLYGTLMLAGRRSGCVITLLVGLFAAAMPVMHMRGTHYPDLARSSGGFFFVWTLWALGGLGVFTFVLSAQGLWALRRSRRGMRHTAPLAARNETVRPPGGAPS